MLIALLAAMLIATIGILNISNFERRRALTDAERKEENEYVDRELGGH